MRMTTLKVLDRCDINCAEDLLTALTRAFSVGGMTAKHGKVERGDGVAVRKLRVIETTLPDGSTVIDFCLDS